MKSATLSSGWAPYQSTVIAGLIFLTIVYGVAYQIVESLSNSQLFVAAPQYCTLDGDTSKGTTCQRPDLFAFQMASACMQLFMGLTGGWLWHKSSMHESQTVQGRLFGHVEHADKLLVGIFVFQVWDFFFSLSIPEHATAVFLIHHLLAALTAYWSLHWQMVQYYAVFFGGCSEISTIFLVVCDFNEYFPASRGSVWSTTVLLCQVLFVITFFYYRVVGWWITSKLLWSDALLVLNETDQNDDKFMKTGRRTAFLYLFLVMNVGLGTLQLYWFAFGILPKILEVLNSS